jgi:nitroreductase
MPLAMTTTNENPARTADHPIDPIFLERWSPRAFTAEAMPHAELLTVLEAARWAPSSFNAQPWRFLYAHRESTHWNTFVGLLAEFNRTWAVRAAVLLFVVSKNVFRPAGSAEEIPSYTHSFDAGAAWAQLALQASRMGWHAHGMAGFDRERAPLELNLSPEYRVEAAVAIGRRGDPAMLPEALQARERPSGREHLRHLVFEGMLPSSTE